jgi:DNA invertase Pin-like site-specific DNA recombinase
MKSAVLVLHRRVLCRQAGRQNQTRSSGTLCQQLLTVIEQLETKEAHFRSLHDPIDMSTPQGMFSLQVLGAVAQIGRVLASKRTEGWDQGGESPR